MDSSVWAILLLVLGISFLMAEIFIPSGGIISIVSAICLLTGVYQAWLAWSSKAPFYFVIYLVVMLVTMPVGVAVAFYLWPHTKLGKRALLSGPSPEEVEAWGDLEREHAELVGRIGTTASVLNPAGMVRIDGKRVVCQSEGSIIEIGRTVKVVAARTNLVIVRLHTPTPEELAPKTPPAAPPQPEPQAPSENANPRPSPAEPERIDFDMT